MKIFIIDDHPETKCYGIMEECRKRNIEMVIEKAVSPALRRIFLLEGSKIDGIILDIGLPTYEDSKVENLNAGESILGELERRKIQIPVLVFSETTLRKNYKPVFDIMKNWYIFQERKKFFDFLDYLEKKSNP